MTIPPMESSHRKVDRLKFPYNESNTFVQSNEFDRQFAEWLARHSEHARSSLRHLRIDLLGGKLTRKGYPVKLQQHPAQLLVYLIQRAGNLVTRDELQEALWPTGRM